MRKFYLCIVFLSFLFTANAQWKTVPLNYNHIRRPDFFIPLCMHFSDNSNGFILTTGSLLQLKEEKWVPANTGDPAAFLYSNVFTVDSNNTFLCGYDGKVSKYNGDSLAVLFTLDASETENTILNTIFMIDSVNGWAAGENGTLVKIEGAGHTMYNLQPMYSFRDIYFDTPDHGWMIGYTQEHADDGGIVFEYINGAWDVHSAVDGRVFDIEFSSPGHGFISTTEDIYQYDVQMNEWKRMFVPDYYQQLHLSLLNDDYGISISDNYQNMIYENGVWSQGPSAAIQDLAGVYTTGYGNAWGISQVGNNNPQDLNEGKIQLLQENVWSSFSIQYLDTVQSLPLDVAVTSIAATDKKNIWFDGGYVNIPEGKDWPDSAPVLKSDTFCTALKMFSDSFGLGLNGDLLEWNGEHWLHKNIDPVANPDTSIANICMHVFDDTTGFICRQLFAWSSGEISNVIARYDYTTNALAVTSIIDSRSPSSIHFSDKQHGWCVGDNGLVVQFTDDNWNVLPSFTVKRLNSVFTVSASAAWAVGDEGALFKFNGTGWDQQQLPTVQNLRSVYFSNNDNGWIVGDSGLIFHYNGNEWVQDSTGTTSTLYSILMIDSSFGFAGGDNGLVLQFTKPVPVIPAVRKFCELSDTWFVYHPSASNGYSFQWQVDTGNGFENLANDTVYSGVNTDSLRLTKVPSAFYGYQYRCIASLEGTDSTSEVEVLKFINRWTGAVNNDWEEPGNWSCGSLPGENTDVIIESGEVNLRSAASIRSLTALPGVDIRIKEEGVLNILK